MAVAKKHHHNSVQFRCGCGQLWKWTSATSDYTDLRDGTYYVDCPCGTTHYKDQTNFRGESKLLANENPHRSNE